MEHSAIIERILREIRNVDILEQLSRISGSDLSTLLLEVYARVTSRQKPADLLKAYALNDFVKPSPLPAIELLKHEIALLSLAELSGIFPVVLSPAAQLGSCSSVASVSQNKVFPAVRGTEILADPTNMLALEVCRQIKYDKLSNKEPIHNCAAGRVLRAQRYKAKNLVQHFNIFGMVSSGRDSGSYAFERTALIKQISFYKDFFQAIFNANISVVLYPCEGYTDPKGLAERMKTALPHVSAEVGLLRANSYYIGLQFNIYIHKNGETINIGDGGFVDWSQKLLQNQKQRMLISAIGIDRLVSGFSS